MRFFLSALIRISMTLASADLRAKLAGKLVLKPKCSLDRGLEHGWHDQCYWS